MELCVYDIGPADLEDQILFCYPANKSQILQLRQIGALQATRQFSGNPETLFIKTKDHLAVLSEVERSVFIYLKIKSETKQLITRILQDLYSRFKMYNHSFMAVRESGRIHAVNYYFTTFCGTMNASLGKLTNIQLFNSSFSGIKYMDSKSNMEISSSLILLSKELQAESGYSVTLLHKDTLVWSGLDTLDDIYLLYTYIIDESVGLYDDGVIEQVKLKGTPVIARNKSNIEFTGLLVKAKQLYFGKVGYMFWVYQVFYVSSKYKTDFTFLFARPVSTNNLEFNEKIVVSITKRYFTSEFTRLQFNGTISKYSKFIFTCFNELNLALATGPQFQSTLQIVEFLIYMQCNLDSHVIREIIHQITPTLWIVGLFINDKQLYLVISDKEQTLATIQTQISTFKAFQIGI